MQFEKDITVRLNGTAYTSQLETVSHTIMADEPLSKGGNDKGPSPQELLLASLGSCVGITVRMYANRKAWDLQNIVVRLNIEKSNPDGIAKTTIVQQLELTGNLTDEQKQRLTEIGNRCPVHKILETGIQII